jgi:hypothetical protein
MIDIRMRRTVAPVAAVGVMAVLWIAAGASHSGRNMVFNEDFSTDPGWTTEEEMYVFYDGSGGSYFALSHDVPSGYGNYFGLSPEFELVDGDFALQFDIAVLEPNWGQYPGLYLLNTMEPDPTGPGGHLCVMQALYSWSDAVPRLFRIHRNGWNLYSDVSPEIGRWYRFELSYLSSSGTMDWRVIDLVTGATFHEVEDAEFPLDSGFNCVAVGERTAPPAYGDYSAIKVDNITIWYDAGSAVEPTTWGRLKAAHR